MASARHRTSFERGRDIDDGFRQMADAAVAKYRPDLVGKTTDEIRAILAKEIAAQAPGRRDPDR